MSVYSRVKGFFKRTLQKSDLLSDVGKGLDRPGVGFPKIRPVENRKYPYLRPMKTS